MAAHSKPAKTLPARINVELVMLLAAPDTTAARGFALILLVGKAKISLPMPVKCKRALWPKSETFLVLFPS